MELYDSSEISNNAANDKRINPDMILTILKLITLKNIFVNNVSRDILLLTTILAINIFEVYLGV
jgi:hypothetical protein